ncbi:MAG: hypothetical protein MJ217_00875 [Bacilli bacterium]|nr:hypothetical protein [Bacilli bacterium]
MKKFIKTLLLGISIASLVGCANNNKSSIISENSSVIESSVEPISSDSVSQISESSPINNSSSSISSSESSSSSIRDEDIYPKSVLESPWGRETAIDTYKVLGIALPYIECDSYEYVIGVDDFGDPDIWFYCMYELDEDANQAYKDYLVICQNKGFSGESTVKRYIDYETLTIYEYESCICDRVILEHHGIELQFLVSMHNGKPCLGIYGITYLYEDPHVYPQIAVEEFAGIFAADVPVISGEGYQYDFMFYKFDDGTDGLEIVVSFAYYDIEEWYFNSLLSSSKFAIGQCDEADEDYFEIMDTYPGYQIGFYYIAYSRNLTIIFEYDIYNGAFVIDLFLK